MPDSASSLVLPTALVRSHFHRRTDNTTPGAGLSGSNPIGVGTIVVDDGDKRRRWAVCSPPPSAIGQTHVATPGSLEPPTHPSLFTTVNHTAYPARITTPLE